MPRETQGLKTTGSLAFTDEMAKEIIKFQKKHNYDFFSQAVRALISNGLCYNKQNKKGEKEWRF